MTTHHDINNAVSLEFNQKRIERLRNKQKPKTALERQKVFYWMLVFVAIFCELFDALLTFSGIVHFGATRLSENAYLLFVLIGLGAVGISVMKHKTLDTFHSQRLDDEFVPKSTYFFMGLFFFIGAVSTYNVTTPAVEYLTKAPILVDVDSIGLRYDSLLAAEIAVISKEIDIHKESARAIHKASSWNGKLDMNSQTKYENALSNRNTATAKRTDLILARNNEKKAAIELAQAKNEKTLQNHKDWCGLIGFYLGWLFIAIEFILYPSKWFCKNYEKMEVIEADAKQKAKEQPLEDPIKKPTKEKITEEEKTKVKDFDNQDVKRIGFVFGDNTFTPKEGDIIPPHGKKSARVYVMVGGELRPMKRSELNILIKGQTTEHRKEHLLNLLKKLEQ